MKVLALLFLLLLSGCHNLTNYDDRSINLDDCTANMNTYFECQSLTNGGSDSDSE